MKGKGGINLTVIDICTEDFSFCFKQNTSALIYVNDSILLTDLIITQLIKKGVKPFFFISADGRRQEDYTDDIICSDEAFFVRTNCNYFN